MDPPKNCQFLICWYISWNEIFSEELQKEKRKTGKSVQISPSYQRRWKQRRKANRAGACTGKSQSTIETSKYLKEESTWNNQKH